MPLYPFCDTTEKPGALWRPAEALQFNGKWLDDEVPGFRTLYTSGRETFAAEVAEIDMESVNGSTFLRRRVLPRTITVGYQLAARTPSELMEALNIIKRIMSKPQSRIMFADEPDKYYVGTCKSIGTPERGRLIVNAEIELYCPDPFKYAESEIEKTWSIEIAETGTKTFSAGLVYPGNSGAYPVVEFDHTGYSFSVFDLTLNSTTVRVSASSSYLTYANTNSVRQFRVDCKSGKVFGGTDYNVEFFDIGSVANDYENMKLENGENALSISVTIGSFADALPDPAVLTIRYRPVWL